MLNMYDCKRKLNRGKGKLREHCYYMVKYDDETQYAFNLIYLSYQSIYPLCFTKYVPDWFHNLSDYDAHLYIKELPKSFKLD